METTPLIIGITGHRDIYAGHVEKIKTTFAQCLQELRATYPNLPLLMLNSLAAGADLITAQVALTQHIPIIAPLPLPVEIYINDFETEAEKELFLQTLQQCQTSFVVEKPTLPFSDNLPNEHDLGYFAAAFYVVKHAGVLVALWNGEDNQHLAGTAKTVQMMLYGYVPPELKPTETGYSLHNTSGLVYHIVTPRIKSSFLSHEAFTIIKKSANNTEY